MHLYSHLPSRLMNVQLMVQQRIQFINSCSERISFLRETGSLLDEIHNHPIIGPYFRNLVKTGEKLTYEIQQELLDLYEKEWIFLSKYCKTVRHKKQLLKIRNLVVYPSGISPASLSQIVYDEINSLRVSLPLYKELKKTHSIIHSFQRMQKRSVCGCLKCKTRRSEIEMNTMRISLEPTSIPLSLNFCTMEKSSLQPSTRQVVLCTNYLSLPLWKSFWKQNASITPSGNLCEKFIEAAIETDEVYFYCRICRLKEIIQFQVISSSENNVEKPRKKFNLRYWEKNKVALWNNEAEKRYKVSLRFALKQLHKNFSQNEYVEIYPFLGLEYYFTKENIQHYLSLLQQRICLVLSEGKFKKNSSAEKICFNKSEEQRIRFREIVKEFWFENPSGTTTECYKIYKSKVGKDCYELSTFKKYIAKDALDPRSPEKKVRGKSRKI